jgi:hypothetical protein
MAPVTRTSSWRPPLSLIGMAFCVWLISFPPKWLSPHPLQPFTITGQALLLFMVLRAFCYWPPMIRWVKSMPVPHRAIFALLIGTMIIGHFTLKNRAYFPYVSWFIFPSVREEDPVTCREFIATTASHKKVRLVVEQLFPSIIQIYPLDDAEHYPPEKLDLLAHAMAKTYNEHHPNDPVCRVDLLVMAVQLHPPTEESRALPSCQLLKRYDISSGQ